MQAASPLMVIQQLPTPDIYSCQHPETATPLKLKHATHTEQFQVYDRINQKQKYHAQSYLMHPRGAEAWFADQEISQKI